jgi:DNA-binding transcriptional LysR family regulator
LDAGFIGFAHEADGAGLAKLKVGRCDFAAVLPKGHPMARRSTLPLEDLADEFFIAISEESFPGASQFVIRACKRAGFTPKILQAAERGHTILGLVASQCGVALLPEPLRALPHSGVVFRPLQGNAGADLYLAWDAQRTHPLREAFMKLAGRRS